VEEQRRLFIGGGWEAPSGADLVEVISAHSENPIAVVAAAGPDHVDRAVVTARRRGIGRELGREGLDTYVDLKAISGVLAS
jgi:acyl-CoA reductase-like NAD-dependent aldehyde dehydrogenase